MTEGHMTPEEIASEWGISTELAYEISDSLQQNSMPQFSVWLITFGTMIGGFVVGWLYLWPTFENLSLEQLFSRPEAESALLYETFLGLGMLAWLFAWIFASSLLPVFVAAFLPMQNRLGNALKLLNDSEVNNFGQSAFNDVLEEAGTITSADEFAKRWLLRTAGRMSKYAIPIFLIGLALNTAELRAGSIHTNDAYVRYPMMPLKEVQYHPWTASTLVQLGCNQTDDGGSLIYEVYFGEESVRVSAATPVPGQGYLSALERIDSAIRTGSAKFERWSWMNRDPLHPKCLRGFYGQLGPDEAYRIDELLRVGEFEEDV